MMRIKNIFIIGIFLTFVYVLSMMCVDSANIEGYRGDNELCGAYKENTPERTACIASYNECGYQECIDKSPIDSSICLLKVGTCYSKNSMDKLQEKHTALKDEVSSMNDSLKSTIKIVTTKNP